MRLLAFALLITHPVGFSQDSVTVHVTVCEALKDLPALNGKMVAVRGELVSTSEGAWLSADCADPLLTIEYSWNDAIWLTAPHSPGVLHKIDFRQDDSALRELRRLVAEKKVHLSQRVWVTYIGLLETFPRLEDRVRILRNGGRVAAGFGHESASPAQLVVRSVMLESVEVFPPE